MIVLYFNPRPREEGDCRVIGISRFVFDFNPRPREEGDLGYKDLALRYLISIHALVKRATRHFQRLSRHVVISIHALVKRATST